MRKIRSLLALLGVTAALTAQGPVAKLDALLLPEIERRLASDDAADVAWGGYLVHHYRLRRAQSAVLAALTRWKERDGLEARIVRLHLVDGLLGAEAVVPAEQVEFLLDDAITREGAFALIAAQGLVNAVALQRLALTEAPTLDPVRMGAAHVLIAGNVPCEALAMTVLDGLEAELSVSVTVPDADSEGGQWNSAVGLGGIQKDGIEGLWGFPPLVRHDLTSVRRVEAVERVLAPEVEEWPPLVLTRREKASFASWELTFREQGAWTRHQREVLLQAMSGVEVKCSGWMPHLFRDKAAYLAEVVPARDAQQAAFDKAVAALRDRKWLGADDLPGYRVEIGVTVHDHRSDKTIPLPELPPPPAEGR